ncbi:MAG: hypothetical protein WBB28_07610 [Crinalium sp.]
MSNKTLHQNFSNSPILKARFSSKLFNAKNVAQLLHQPQLIGKPMIASIWKTLKDAEQKSSPLNKECEVSNCEATKNINKRQQFQAALHAEPQSCIMCSGLLLRHVRQNGLYWVCTSCRQEVPIILSQQLPRHARPQPAVACVR